MADQVQGAGGTTQPKVGEIRQGDKGAELFVKQGGQSGWMPAGEVASGFSRTDDYTRKSQALAERERKLQDREQVLGEREQNFGREGSGMDQRTGFDGQLVPPGSNREQPVAAGSRLDPPRSIDAYDDPGAFIQQQVRRELGPVMQQVETMRQQNDALQQELATQQGKARLVEKYPDIKLKDIAAAIAEMPEHLQGEYNSEVGYSLLHVEMKAKESEQGAGELQGAEGEQHSDTPYTQDSSRSSAQLPGGSIEPLPETIRVDDRAAMTAVGKQLEPTVEKPPGG